MKADFLVVQLETGAQVALSPAGSQRSTRPVHRSVVVPNGFSPRAGPEMPSHREALLHGEAAVPDRLGRVQEGQRPPAQHHRCPTQRPQARTHAHKRTHTLSYTHTHTQQPTHTINVQIVVKNTHYLS